MIASSMTGPGASKIAQLLISHGANCKLKNKDGWTSMHLACKHGNIDIVELLASTEPNLLLEPSRNGRLPIHIAGII
jgi:ankyrin repeat protein